VISGPAGVGGGCVVLGVNVEVGSCHGKGRQRDFCWWWWLCKGRRWESWVVTLGSRGNMVPAGGGDFAEEEDGEGCLGTMVFNFRRMTSSLESMETWAMMSLTMEASRRSTQATECSASSIEEQQAGPIVRNRGHKPCFEDKENLLTLKYTTEIPLCVFISLNEYLYMISWLSDSEKKEKS